MRSVLVSVTVLSLLVSSMGCAGTKHEETPVDWMLGSWHGIRRSGEDGTEAPMTVRVEPLADGEGQMECLHVEGKNGPYVGFAVRRRDRSGHWTMVYANSTQHPFARLKGSVAGERTSWVSVTPGRTRELRLQSDRIGVNAWRKTNQVSEDGGKTWRVLFVDELERDQGE